MENAHFHSVPSGGGGEIPFMFMIVYVNNVYVNCLQVSFRLLYPGKMLK